MSLKSYLVPLLGVLLITAGCDVFDQGCDLVLVPGIFVNVIDSASGEPVPVEASAVSATDGDYTEYPDEDGTRAGWPIWLERRPGVYRVEVNAPGYVPWEQEGVRVESTDCGNITTQVTASLQPVG